MFLRIELTKFVFSIPHAFVSKWKRNDNNRNNREERKYRTHYSYEYERDIIIRADKSYYSVDVSKPTLNNFCALERDATNPHPHLLHETNHPKLASSRLRTYIGERNWLVMVISTANFVIWRNSPPTSATNQVSTRRKKHVGVAEERAKRNLKVGRSKDRRQRRFRRGDDEWLSYK